MLSRRNFIRAGAAGFALGSGVLPRLAAASPAVFHLQASNGEVSFMPGQELPTRVMYYNQAMPGPVLRLPQGRESTIHFTNRLDDPSTVHWHGLRIDNAMDGVPDLTQASTKPGETFEYRFTPPDAGTYWYHSHHRAWRQRALGLAGVLIVEEKNPPQVDQDLVFAIDDWRLDDDMQVDYRSFRSMHDWAHAGRLGKFITVNGVSEMRYPVRRGERVRLRLVNIANSRIMSLLIGEPATVIAYDGQPIEPFRLNDGRVVLAPGQRVDLIIDLMAKPGSRTPLEVVIGEYAYEVAGFDYADNALRDQPLDSPIRLEPNPLQQLSTPDEFLHVPVQMQGGAMGRMHSAILHGKEMGIRELVKNEKVWAINGIAGMSEEPLFRVKRGTAVSLDVDNDNRWPHAMHLHGHHFFKPERPDVWRDVVLFDRGERGSMQFVADNPGKWLIHCHMVEHMAGGMMTWFEVT